MKRAPYEKVCGIAIIFVDSDMKEILKEDFFDKGPPHLPPWLHHCSYPKAYFTIFQRRVLLFLYLKGQGSIPTGPPELRF